MDFHFQRTYRGPLKAAIFDWAGTTVDFGCFAPAVVFAEVFRRRGIDVTMDQAREPMGMNKRDHVKAITRMGSVAEQWRRARGGDCTEADIDDIYREFIPMQLDVLSKYSALIPGTLATIADCRRRGLKIGSTTGYNGDMLEIIRREAKWRGYEPDAAFSASDVPTGRPAPWMCLRNAMELGVYPMEACVKVGDTVPDIDEGLNAGMWSVGVILGGNEIGLLPEQMAALPPAELLRRRNAVEEKFLRAGAHFAINTIGELPAVLDEINTRLGRGERPI